MITEKQIEALRDAHDNLTGSSSEIIGRAMTTPGASGPIKRYTDAEFDLGRIIDDIEQAWEEMTDGQA